MDTGPKSLCNHQSFLEIPAICRKRIQECKRLLASYLHTQGKKALTTIHDPLSRHHFQFFVVVIASTCILQYLDIRLICCIISQIDHATTRCYRIILHSNLNVKASNNKKLSALKVWVDHTLKHKKIWQWPG